MSLISHYWECIFSCSWDSPIPVIVSGLSQSMMLILATISLWRENKKFGSFYLVLFCSCHSPGQWLLSSWAWQVWLQECWELRSWRLGRVPSVADVTAWWCHVWREVCWQSGVGKVQEPWVTPCPGLWPFLSSLRTAPYSLTLYSPIPWTFFLFHCQGLPLDWPLGLKPVLFPGYCLK